MFLAPKIREYCFDDLFIFMFISIEIKELIKFVSKLEARKCEIHSYYVKIC